MLFLIYRGSHFHWFGRKRAQNAYADGSGPVIIGLGSDLCNIERIAKSIERFGARFENRVFTDVERAKAAKRPSNDWSTRSPACSCPSCW
jgi:hypothetical protein